MAMLAGDLGDVDLDPLARARSCGRDTTQVKPAAAALKALQVRVEADPAKTGLLAGGGPRGPIPYLFRSP